MEHRNSKSIQSAHEGSREGTLSSIGAFRGEVDGLAVAFSRFGRQAALPSAVLLGCFLFYEYNDARARVSNRVEELEEHRETLAQAARTDDSVVVVWSDRRRWHMKRYARVVPGKLGVTTEVSFARRQCESRFEGKVIWFFSGKPSVRKCLEASHRLEKQRLSIRKEPFWRLEPVSREGG